VDEDPVVLVPTPEATPVLTKVETDPAVRTEEDVLSTVNLKLAECEFQLYRFKFRFSNLTFLHRLLATLRRLRLLDGELRRASRNSRLRLSLRVTPRRSNKPLPELLPPFVKLPSRRRTTLKPTSNTSPLKLTRSSTSLPSPRPARPTKV